MKHVACERLVLLTKDLESDIHRLFLFKQTIETTLAHRGQVMIHWAKRSVCGENA